MSHFAIAGLQLNLKSRGNLDYVLDKIKYKETITKGFENAPQGLRDVLTGKNFGKQLIEI